MRTYIAQRERLNTPHPVPARVALPATAWSGVLLLAILHFVARDTRIPRASGLRSSCSLRGKNPDSWGADSNGSWRLLQNEPSELSGCWYGWGRGSAFVPKQTNLRSIDACGRHRHNHCRFGMSKMAWLELPTAGFFRLSRFSLHFPLGPRAAGSPTQPLTTPLTSRRYSLASASLQS